MRTAAAAIVVACCAGGALAQVNLDHLKTIDLSSTSLNTNPEFIGSNPSAVAWDGVDAYVGGYNQSGAAQNTGIVRISNALGAHSIGSAFGLFSTNNLRGMTGLSIKNGMLAASLDNGAGNVNSVRAFNPLTGTQNWATGGGTPDATRRGNAIAFDPGFNGTGPNQGVAYLSIGSGRRHLEDATTGNYINGQNAGAIINFATATTTWRGMAFDPGTGDLYTRESNRVGKAVRNGDNSYVAPATQIFLTVAASAVDQQNIAFINSADFGDFLIFNDRSVTTGGQAFSSVVKVISTSGASMTLNFPNADFSPASGNGAYSFSFDAGTQTLAVTDFANRQLHIFAVPAPGSLALLGLGGLAAMRRRR